MDYFIHKDAEGFLKEQFDIFLFQYLAGDNALYNNWIDSPEKITNLQKLKRIAHKIITYIARFEDELKHIWEKKKIVKQVNYVFTFDRLFPVGKEGNRDFAYKNAITLVEKIVNDKGFDKQIEEYKLLREKWVDSEGEEIKKEWKEFTFVTELNKKDLFVSDKKQKKFNTDFHGKQSGVF